MHRSILILAILTLVLASAAPVLAGQDGNIQLAQLGMQDDDIWDESGNLITDDGSPDRDIVADTPDPIEGFNRAMFQLNDGLYTGIFHPLATGYSYVVPEMARGWVQNFFHNLLFPVRFVNCILQGKLASAGMQTSAFIFNSTVGLGGLADVIEDRRQIYDIPSGEEDFGQTLGWWGAGNGFYVVWPILGPSSGRDTVGMVGDYFLDPVNYVEPWYDSLAIHGYRKINELSLNLDAYDELKAGAIDPYMALRDAYLRMRARAVAE